MDKKHPDWIAAEKKLKVIAEGRNIRLAENAKLVLADDEAMKEYIIKLRKRLENQKILSAPIIKKEKKHWLCFFKR